MWRKYHQVFGLLDDDRLADVARDFGPDFNPFDVHRRAVIALETLIARPRLTEQAVAAGIDLLVVDEAHRLRRPPGHAGDPAWRAIAPIAGLGRHVLLLTATPFEDDVHGFFRLLQLLRPDEFPDEEDFEARLARADPLPPCTSSTRRSDIGGLPPRVARPVEAAEAGDWTRRLDLEDVLRRPSAGDPVARRRKIDRVRRGLASGAALIPLLSSAESVLKAKAEAADANDPRVGWLVRERAPGRTAGTEDARVRRPPRDAGDAAHGLQPPRAAGDGRVPRVAHVRPARHRGGAVPASRGAQPARLDGVRGRGPQLSSSATGSSSSTCPGAPSWSSSASDGSTGSAAACPYPSCISGRPRASERKPRGSWRASASSASRWRGWSRSSPTSKTRWTRRRWSRERWWPRARSRRW
jgi:hypothetical protein